MKIMQTSFSGLDSLVDISDAISGTIDDAASDCGIAESGNEKANKAGEILGKLIQALHEQDLLTDSQIADMIGWRYEVKE